MAKKVKWIWNRIFIPINKTKKRYVIMKGSAGSGKSVDTAQYYIKSLMSTKGRNLLVLRKTSESNHDSTFAELCSVITQYDLWDYWTATQKPPRLRCINKNMIFFRGMFDDRQREKVKSITVEDGKLTDVWLEEATEFTQEDFDYIDDRLRGILQNGMFYQLRATFNPVSSAHWLKATFFDRVSEDVETHHSTYKDNRFIDKAYYKRMERRKELDPEGYKIYGLGDWGETGGLILSNYIIHEFDNLNDNWDGESIGQDFGFNHANATLLLGWKDGEVYIRTEIYKHGLDTTELIQEADKVKLSKRIQMYCDAAEPDRIKMWAKAGYKSHSAMKGKGSVNAQIDWLKGVKIHIHPSCANTIKEIQQWRWKKNQTSGQYQDEPININDDAMAALRYGVQPWRTKQKNGW